jgi:hypothetical protein
MKEKERGALRRRRGIGKKEKKERRELRKETESKRK